MPHLGIRINESLARRLDELKESRGLRDRSDVVRALIREASMDPAERDVVPDRDELLVLLGDSARSGSVTAMKALLEERRRDGNSDDEQQSKDPFGEADEVARKRAERAVGT